MQILSSEKHLGYVNLEDINIQIVFELRGIIHLGEVIELTLEEKNGWGINLIKKGISGKSSDMIEAPKGGMI